MKKRKVLTVNLSDRTYYTLVSILIFVVLAIGVYAVVPNPGHAASDIEGDALTGYEYVSSTESNCWNLGWPQASVSCPQGKVVIGGGCTYSTGLGFDQAELAASGPTGFTPAGWACYWSGLANGAQDTCTAWAFCVDEPA